MSFRHLHDRAEDYASGRQAREEEEVHQVDLPGALWLASEADHQPGDAGDNKQRQYAE